MASVTVSTLVKAHTTFYLQSNWMTSHNLLVRRQHHDKLPAIRLKYQYEKKELGNLIEDLICDTLTGISIDPQHCASDGRHDTLRFQLEQYRRVLATCASNLEVTTQEDTDLSLSYEILGYRVNGRCDAMLNQVNVLEIKHTSKDVGVDQLIHYAALRYLMTKKKTWYITVCNTNKGTVTMYMIPDKFYNTGEALGYLEESVVCWAGVPAVDQGSVMSASTHGRSHVPVRADLEHRSVVIQSSMFNGSHSVGPLPASSTVAQPQRKYKPSRTATRFSDSDYPVDTEIEYLELPMAPRSQSSGCLGGLIKLLKSIFS